MAELQKELQRLSGTTLDAQGAANAWAGTTGLELVGARRRMVRRRRHHQRRHDRQLGGRRRGRSRREERLMTAATISPDQSRPVGALYPRPWPCSYTRATSALRAALVAATRGGDLTTPGTGAVPPPPVLSHGAPVGTRGRGWR